MQSRSSYRAVIFDLDGLMLDTERIAADAWMRAASELGCPIDESVVMNMIGRTGPDSDAILRSVLGTEFPLEELKQLRLTHTDFRIVNSGIPVKPGLIDLLDFLDERQIKKAVATSSTRERAAMKLGRAGLLERFPIVVSSDDVKRGKPAPDIYEKAAHHLHASATDCLVLEDSEPGVRAAFAAGMTVIMIPDLKPPSDAVLPLAFRIEKSLSDVLAYLPSLLA